MTEIQADARRCCTCQRWHGPRVVATEAGKVLFEHDEVRGECFEGPWHGTPRSLRNACGRWFQWLELLPSVRQPGQSG